MLHSKYESQKNNYGEHWECPYGNHTMASGYDTSNINGRAVEPSDDIWNGLYACLECGRIIDQDSLEVVSRTSDFSLLRL